jgi:hypothetical protein
LLPKTRWKIAFASVAVRMMYGLPPHSQKIMTSLIEAFFALTPLTNISLTFSGDLDIPEGIVLVVCLSFSGHW